MDLLYKNRSLADQGLIREVCEFILSQKIEEKQYNENFCFIFIDGRPNINFNTLEHNAMFTSCRLYSKNKYPIFCFVNNENGLNELKNKYNLTIIKIKELNNLDEYSNFWRFELYNLIPQDIIHGITVQADGFLLRYNFEDFILKNNWAFIGAHFKHLPSIDVKINNERWNSGAYKVYGFNGGFSYRNLEICRKTLNHYKNFTFRERFAPENKPPQEDLLLSVLLNQNGYKIPTLKDADLWSKDPLTLEDWENNKYGYGFHYFRTVSEFPPCNHD